MNFGKGIKSFLGFLKGARLETHGPIPVPEKPATSIFAGYDPGEKVVIDFVDDKSAQEFLYFGVIVQTPQSSNVAWIQYWVADFQLVVGFKNSYVYEYPGTNVELAYDFLVAASKGKWVWDNLRTTRRAYEFLYSLNGRRPVRMEDPAAGSVKAALGSLSILGVDPFVRTKSAKRVAAKYAALRAEEAKIPKFAFHKQFSYQFTHKKRKKLGLKAIRAAIRGGP